MRSKKKPTVVIFYRIYQCPMLRIAACISDFNDCKLEAGARL